jgi:hypothetical protein
MEAFIAGLWKDGTLILAIAEEAETMSIPESETAPTKTSAAV